jgi:CelD/BcsL family acetyltransferase involved in cellulose biosynthesis
LADALDLGPGVWDGLLGRSGTGGPFMTWAWHRAWACGSDADEVESARVVVLRSAAGELEALFPFRVYRTRFRRVPVVALGWAIGDLGCPDYLELPASPEADLDALVGALEDVPWDVIVLSNVAEGASNLDRFSAACERRGWKARRTALWRCPYLELPDSWDAYLASFSQHRRHEIRRMERKLRRERKVALTDYEPGRIEDGWRHLTRLHALRWGGNGVLRERAWERLHRSFASWLAECHQLWLTTLDVDGRPVAACYGFSFGDTVYYYQTGWDPLWARDNVAMILRAAMIRRAIERGYRRFDFLRGEEPYKLVWTSTARVCYELVIVRPRWRALVLRGLDWIATRRAPKWLRGAMDRFRHVRGGQLDHELI